MGGRPPKTVFGENDMKTQMKFQKYLALGTLILAALTFVLAAFFCSGAMYESSFWTSKAIYSDPETYLDVEDIIGADKLYNFSQMANDILIMLAIVFILAAVLVYLFATNSRRNYYVTNYISIGIVIGAAALVAIVGLVCVIMCFVYYGQIDVAKWMELVAKLSDPSDPTSGHLYPQNFSTNVATLYLGVVLYLVVLVDIAAWVCNLIWKRKLMQGEKALLAQGENKEVA